MQSLPFIGMVLAASALAGITNASQIRIPATAEQLENCLVLKGIKPSSITIRDRIASKPEYNLLNYQWNKYHGLRAPFAYVVPETVEQVQNTIRCTQSLGIRVTARSGGHSAQKYSFGSSDSVVIDFQKQNAVFMNSANRTVEVESGVRVGSDLLSSEGYFLPRGLCKTVGISYSLGGGYTNFARLFGYTVDSILELEMVDYTGSLLTVNSVTNSDLFWALRGAGTGGSFGLITRYKFKLHPVPQQIIYGRSVYPLHMFPQVFDAYQKFSISNADRHLYLGMLTRKTGIKVELVQTLLKDQNVSSATVYQSLRKFFPSTNSTLISSLDYSDFRTASLGFMGAEPGDAFKTIDNQPMYMKEKSFFARKVIGSSDITKINELIQNSTAFVTTLWQLHGGAIDDVATEETAFVHRTGVLYKVNLIYGAPVNRTEAEETESLEWLGDFYEVTKSSMGHTGSYQNIPDDELKDYLERYYGTNLQRLRQIKSKYDPGNYFQFEQSIPPM